MTDNEIWKSPPSIGRPWFEVSNLGRIRTLNHTETIIRMGLKITRKRYGVNPHFPAKDSRGRYQASVGSDSRKGKNYLVLVHKLVAECFVPNPNPKKFNMIFFRDRNPSNPKADNLFWGNINTKGRLFSENCPMVCGVGLFRSWYDDKPFQTYRSIAEYSREYGITKQAGAQRVNSGAFVKDGITGYYVKRIGDRFVSDETRKKLVEAQRRFRDRQRSELKKVPEQLPESVFLHSEIDITPKPVFKK